MMPAEDVADTTRHAYPASAMVGDYLRAAAGLVPVGVLFATLPVGAVELVRESELSPASLAAAIERAAAREPATVAIDIDGAANSARLILTLIEGHTPGISPRDLAAKTGTAMIHR